jgi:hypothetical protein
VADGLQFLLQALEHRGSAATRAAPPKPAICSHRPTAGLPRGFDTGDLKEAKALLDKLTEPAITAEG